jgi:hypothetical protein
MTTATAARHPVEHYLTTRHLFDFGGYPYPSRWDGDTFWYADLGRSEDDIKRATIEKMTRAEMDEWLAEARKWAEDHNYGGNGELGLPQDDSISSWYDYDWEPFRETSRV